MRVKVYRGWIDHCEYLVDAPNMRRIIEKNGWKEIK